LNNLISNAIKYKDVSKEESFVTIFVECDNENAIITIEDNGIGIAEDKQGRVFEMFYRATKLPLVLRSWYVYCKRNTRETRNNYFEIERKKEQSL
jgi:light-regulated signal transduction histidine kinase (bacteriophytochrome)